MDGTQFLHTGTVESLQGANPEFEVGVDGILHEDGNVNAAEGIGKCLHGKGVSRSTRTYPKNVDAVFQGEFHMLGGGDLGGYEHTGLLLYLLHPGKGLFAVALEAAWLGAWLPDACTEVVAAQ